MNAAGIIDAVVGQSGTDASRSTLLGLLNEVHASQVADSRWYRTAAVVGTTGPGQQAYPITNDIVEGYGMQVGTDTYYPVGEDQIWALNSGTSKLGNVAGVYSRGFDSAGATAVHLFPVPTSTGVPITVNAARVPADLSDATASVPVTPTDTHTSLIEGVTALVLMRVDERPDLAAPFQQRFDFVTEKLRKRKNSLIRGGQPAQLQVQGIHY